VLIGVDSDAGDQGRYRALLAASPLIVAGVGVVVELVAGDLVYPAVILDAGRVVILGIV